VNLRSSIEIFIDDIETGALPMFRDERGGNLPTGDAVSGVEGRDSHSGFRTELENLSGDGKRKGTSGSHREAESSDASDDEAGVMLVEGVGHRR
jgi:hypothetical protein